ncbi:hypothetical protein Tco_0695080 [Tanacetum coccineum]
MTAAGQGMIQMLKMRYQTPIYDKEPMTGGIIGLLNVNIFAIEQQHTEQPELIVKGSRGNSILKQEVNSHAKTQSNKTTNRNKPVDQKSHTQKPGRQIFTKHRFSPNTTFAVYEKTSPRSDLRWKPTDRIFESVGLRWISTGKLFDSCTSKVDSEPPHGSNLDIPNIHACKQTLDVSAEVIIIESDISCDHKPFQATSDESSDHNPFEATSDESSDHNLFQSTFDESSNHNPFQATSDESSDHNPFEATSDDTLKSISEDTCSFNSTWEQKKLLKVNQGLDLPKQKKDFDGKQRSSSAKAKKDTIPSEIVQWYDDLSLDEKRTVYKGRRGSSFRNAAIIKPEKPKLRSKHLAPRTGLTCTTLVVPTKRPPCVLGLAAVTTWQQILNKEFGIKRSKADVGGSLNVRWKGKRKML